ncbi:MAG: LysM domain-containing protein [Acidimicrobiia bacterium]
MADLELTLRELARTGASATAIAGLTLLVLALAVELLRRRHTESALLRIADRLVPTPVQRVAAAILTLLATVGSVAMPSVASADTSLRGWLESPSVPTTVVTPSTSSASGPPPTAPQPAPAPVATPSPSAAPVLHPRLPATSPTSSPGSARTPPTAAAAPTAPAIPTRSTPAAADPPDHVEHSVQYVVVAGDCLWDIAARGIGPGAPNAAIDRGWRAIYAANRIAIGDDPGLIHPGLVLAIPAFDPAP